MVSLLRTLLEIEGYQVDTFQSEDVTSLLKHIQNHPPDTILLDVHLRYANGLNLLNAIRQNPNTHSVRVIMSSGMDLRDRCIACGADDFVLKPYMPDELLNIIQKSTQPTSGIPPRT